MYTKNVSSICKTSAISFCILLVSTLANASELIKEGEIFNLYTTEQSTDILSYDQKKGKADVLEVFIKKQNGNPDFDSSNRQSHKIQRLQFNQKEKKLLWELQFQADEMRIDKKHNYISKSAFGTGGGQNSYRLYSLEVGKYLFPYTLPKSLEPYMVWVNGEKLFVGFHNSSWAIVDGPTKDASPVEGQAWQYFGFLTLSNAQNIYEQYAVYRKPWGDPAQDPSEIQIMDSGNKVYWTSKNSKKNKIDTSQYGKLKMVIAWEDKKGDIFVDLDLTGRPEGKVTSNQNFKIIKAPKDKWNNHDYFLQDQFLKSK